MAPRTRKHLCILRIISHTEDYSKLLASCSQSDCYKLAYFTPKRRESAVEFKERWKDLPHLCC